VKKVTLTRVVERDSGLFRGFNDFFVAHGATRLNNCPHSSVKQNLQSIGKWEKCVRGGNGSRGSLPSSSYGQLAGVDAVDLAHSNTDARVALSQQDRI